MAQRFTHSSMGVPGKECVNKNSEFVMELINNRPVGNNPNNLGYYNNGAPVPPQPSYCYQNSENTGNNYINPGNNNTELVCQSQMSQIDTYKIQAENAQLKLTLCQIDHKKEVASLKRKITNQEKRFKKKEDSFPAKKFKPQNKEADGLRKEIRALRKKGDDDNRQIKALETKVAKNEHDLKVSQKRIGELETGNGQLEQKILTLEQDKEKLETEVSNQKKKVQELESLVAQQQLEIKASKEKHDRKKKILQDIILDLELSGASREEKIKKLKKQLKDEVKGRSKAERKNNGWTEFMNNCNSKLDAVINLVATKLLNPWKTFSGGSKSDQKEAEKNKEGNVLSLHKKLDQLSSMIQDIPSAITAYGGTPIKTEKMDSDYH